MPSKQLNFYATFKDLETILEQFEAQERVTYVRTGLFDSDIPIFVGTFRAINDLSVSTDGDANHIPGYLVVANRDQVTARKVPQRGGGDKFAIDQSQVPDSLYFQSGGVYPGKIIVPGRIGIVHLTSVSKRLYDSFAKLLVRHFTKIKSYYVGQEALDLWQNGMRLSLSLKASKDIDLR